MNREIYASDGEYTLCPITDEDRENYANLYNMMNDDETMSNVKDMLCQALQSRKKLTYSIFDAAWEYCGNMELQNPDDDTPEIGIDLVESKRNMGIAAKAVRLLAGKAYEERKVEYFLIRISSKNTHSRHVFEKMGAVLIGEESSLWDRFLDLLEKDGETELLEYIQNRFDNKTECEKSVIYKYKLLPEVFNK